MGLIPETQLTKETYIKLKGFKVYSTIHSHNDAKGGSAIIIKDSINHYEDHPMQSKEIQLTTIVIKSNTQDVKIGAVSSPPPCLLYTSRCV